MTHHSARWPGPRGHNADGEEDDEEELTQHTQHLAAASSAAAGNGQVHNIAYQGTSAATSPSQMDTSTDDEDDLAASPYSIEDLPRAVISRALRASSGDLLTAAECGHPNGRDVGYLIQDGGVTWIVSLFDRESPFAAKDKHKFLDFLRSVCLHRNDPSIRGAILCRNRPSYEERNLTPFPIKTQRTLLCKEGVILLSIDSAF